MRNLPSTIRYTLWQFRLSPVFTSAAILTLALGIGGTTAIFTMIHAVMLRSLPVSDPSLLYRIGDGDNCCVEGGPQDRWGMYSFPLYERLKAQTPEFRRSSRVSGRREPFECTPARQRPRRKISALRVCHGKLFLNPRCVGAFGGRVFSHPTTKLRQRR